MILKKITLENFQGHIQKSLEFSSTINAIIGESEAGKSAFFKAFEFVLFDRFADEDYIHDGATDCKVTLVFSEDDKDVVTIQRTRDEKGSKYIVNGVAYNKSGSVIGLTILADLGYHISDLNKFGQYDSHYLIGLSKSDAGKVIQEFFNVDQFIKFKDTFQGKVSTKKVLLKDANTKHDKFLHYLNDEFYSSKSFIENSIKQLEEIDESIAKNKLLIEKLKDIVEYTNNINLIDKYLQIYKKYVELKKVNNNLKSKKAVLSKYNSIKNMIIFLTPTLTTLDKCVKLHNKQKNNIKKLSILKDLNDYKGMLKTLNLYIPILLKNKEVIINNNLNHKKKIALSKYKEVKDNLNIIDKFIPMLTELSTYYKQNNIIIKYLAIQQELNSINMQLEEYKDNICPTCGQVIKG